MKLSICIPVYNFGVEDLIKTLHSEISTKQIDAEIIIIDDASTKVREQFQELEKYCEKLIQLKKNQGRSKVRNLFIKYANGDYLLILDCDVKVENPNFVENYIQFLEENPSVDLIYGGFTILDDVKNLRNYYSAEREISTNFGKAPFETFKTANFIIKKEVFKKHPFNENLRQYGYEDYLFAKTLQNSSINYYFLDNSVVHQDYSSNKDYLEKIKQSMHSLHLLSSKVETKSTLEEMKLLKAVTLLKKYRLQTLFNFYYSLIEKKIEKNLLSSNPSIRNLDLYKLGTFLKIK